MIRVLNYGGGTNSTALAIMAVKKKIPIDIIVFADTGSEFPHTYEYVKIFNSWLRENGSVEIDTVKWIRTRAPHVGEFIPLHDWCIQHKTVPSRAFGFSGCTSKWKQQPADQFIRQHPLVRQEHESGRPVERWVGYDAGEDNRAERMLSKNPNPNLWTWRAPLVEWDIDRDDCVEIIRETGLPLPGKSSCWMCPSMKKGEILEFARMYPDLFQFALKIEGQAELRNRKGLGGHFAWKDLIQGVSCGPDAADVPCGCYDG